MELNDIQAKIEALRRELAQLEELKKEAEAKIPTRIVVLKIEGDVITLMNNKFDPRYVEVMRQISGRRFLRAEGDVGYNTIPTSSWEVCVLKLASAGFNLEYEPGVKEAIEARLNAPEFFIRLHKGGFLMQKNPGVYRGVSLYDVYRIPGFNDIDGHNFFIPASEGWRLFQIYGENKWVAFEQDAIAEVQKQVSRRAKLHEISQKKDSDFILELNGHLLKPFQRVGVEFIYETGGRMILGDETGLGKTWQSIAYAELMRRQKPNFQTIVVCKASNKPNWVREIERLTGTTPVVCFGGSPDFSTIQQITGMGCQKAHYVVINYDILASTVEVDRPDGNSETAWPWVAIIKGAKPDLLILDEAHLIKNPDAKRSVAARQLKDIQHVIPMTATPILNRANEFWSILHMIEPEIFSSYARFEATYTINGRQPRNVEYLQEMLRPRFLRRLKKDVQPDLPPINRMVKYYELSDRASRVYQKVLMGIWTMLAEFDPQGVERGESKVMSVLAQIQRLKQICAIDKVDFTSDLATEIIDGTDDENAKVLIFTQFKGSAVAIAQRLGSEAVCTVRRTRKAFVSLDSWDRDALFESVRKDPNIKYVVTTEAAKEGHNLEFCNWVIFNDLLWTPAGHDQCEGRAYGRLSNPHPIDSYYVVADVEIERWIWELLSRKLAIINETVEGIERSREMERSLIHELIEKIIDARRKR